MSEVGTGRPIGILRAGGDEKYARRARGAASRLNRSVNSWSTNVNLPSSGRVH